VSHNWWYVINGTLAAAVAYLRIAGDKHYFSDVLTGAAIGTVMGVLVPLLHKKQSGTSRRLSLWASPSDGGGLLGFTWKY
ncbi:phosphatase PAP2 family protein, partial [Myxococcota bacterium]|nr:phosphatase PAP2 family protein [Myxococcota bacterium]MBU1536946.1 phosphatase PAP2 family protein [Myxococcota bacterium]